jgi:hypothetical protein
LAAKSPQSSDVTSPSRHMRGRGRPAV